MARSRFDKLEPEKQEAILAAAAGEFAERGFGAASLNRIIERAGSNKGTLYYYFEDKADLFATVVERAVARLMSEVRWPGLEAFTAEGFWEQVREVYRRSIELLNQGTWYVRISLAYHRLVQEPAARAAAKRVVDLQQEVTRQFLQRGQQLGVIRNDVPLELLVEMMVAMRHAGDRWMLDQWDDLTEPEHAKLLEARLDITRDMLDARNVGWER